MKRQKGGNQARTGRAAAPGLTNWVPSTHRPTIMGTRGMVSSGHYLATLAGVRMLQQGGNAVDAGVAAGLCINVLQPDMTNLGGVAPIIIYPADKGEVVTISGLGVWPQAASLRFFQEQAGGKLPVGVLRSVVPAAADAWVTALDRYGTATFAQAAESAIELAEGGFPVYGFLHSQIEQYQEMLCRWPSSAEVFLPRGRPPAVGEVLIQRDLANTLKRMAAAEQEHRHQGRHAGLMAARDLFYRGDIAATMVQFCQEQGGLLTMEDLARFQVGVEEPVKTDYRGYDVYCCGPWCQGPVLAQALNLLECYDLAALGHNTIEYAHLLAEALKLVFADREKHYGDPRFVPVPIGGLLSKQYAQQRRELINPNRAWPEMPPPGQPGRVESDAGAVLSSYRGQPGRAGPVQADTSYVCVVDSQGNAFSATPSDPFSDTPIVPGLGITISSRGSQSWLDPEHPSSVQPGKRPRLTPNPAIVLKDGKLFMAFGTPGGDVQCQAMLQVFLNIVEFGMDPQQAIEAPRFATFNFPNSFYPHRYYPGRLDVEGRLPGRVLAGLRARGHGLQKWADWDPAAGAVCAIVADPETGVLKGGADPRRFSYALGW